MTEYDDKRYLELVDQLNSIISELLEMDGNDGTLIREEVDQAIANYEEK